MAHVLRLVALSCVGILAFSGCTSKSEVAAIPAPASSPKAPARTLNLAVWSNYISPELISEFEKTSGIQVNVSNYSSNEELLAKLQAGASGIDVAVPSDYMVFAMAKLGLLTDLDRLQVPNLKNLDVQFLGKSYDPKNQVSLPYNWGTTGIAINHDLVKVPIKGWKDLFGLPELKGKFSLLDDAREAIGAALKAQGFDLNTKDSTQLAQAKALLLKQRSRIKAFNSETKMALINGEVAVAQAYSSDAMQAGKATGGKIEYVIPAEGGTIWFDNLVVPKGAKNPKEAHALINFLLEPKSALGSVTNLYLASANKAAMELIPAEFKSNLRLFPIESIRAKLETMEDLGEGVAQYDRIWTEIKASSE